jgi:hypothetical protein
MKRLLVIPFIFSLVACGPAIEKIKDRSGGCAMGKCTNGGQTKPTSCSNSSVKITNFIGYTFATPEEKNNAGVRFKAQFQFSNTNAAFTQYCENSEGYANPTILTTFSTNIKGDRLTFNEPAVKEQKFGKESCKAEVTGDNFKVSYEGLCLVLENKKGEKFYYEKKSN